MLCLVRSNGVKCFRLAYHKPSLPRNTRDDDSCGRKLRETGAEDGQELGQVARST